MMTRRCLFILLSILLFNSAHSQLITKLYDIQIKTTDTIYKKFRIENLTDSSLSIYKPSDRYPDSFMSAVTIPYSKISEIKTVRRGRPLGYIIPMALGAIAGQNAARQDAKLYPQKKLSDLALVIYSGIGILGGAIVGFLIDLPAVKHFKINSDRSNFRKFAEHYK
jgi:hypothetical protein